MSFAPLNCIKAVLLVGGFGESKFIYNRLRTSHAPNGINVLQVSGAFVPFPNDSTLYLSADLFRWSSVCRGATLWGLEHPNETITIDSLAQTPSKMSANAPTVTSRISRYSYGVSMSEEFDQRIHLLQDGYQDPKTGHFMAKQQMTWLLKRVWLCKAPDTWGVWLIKYIRERRLKRERC